MAEVRLPLHKGTKNFYDFSLLLLFRGLSILSRVIFFRQVEFYNAKILNCHEKTKTICDDKIIITIVINNIVIIIK